METFKVTKVNHITSIADELKKEVSLKFSKGIEVVRTSVEIPSGNHIDDLIDEIESTTNLLITRTKISGCGFSHNTENGKVWNIRVFTN